MDSDLSDEDWLDSVETLERGIGAKESQQINLEDSDSSRDQDANVVDHPPQSKQNGNSVYSKSHGIKAGPTATALGNITISPLVRLQTSPIPSTSSLISVQSGSRSIPNAFEVIMSSKQTTPSPNKRKSRNNSSNKSNPSPLAKRALRFDDPSSTTTTTLSPPKAVVSYHKIDVSIVVKILEKLKPGSGSLDPSNKVAIIKAIIEKGNKESHEDSGNGTIFELIDTNDVEESGSTTTSTNGNSTRIGTPGTTDAENSSPSPGATPTDYSKDYGFKTLIYGHHIGGNHGLLQYYGIQLHISHYSLLIFYYSENDIFAITTSSAWKFIQWCCDYEFPEKFAARLLTDEGNIKAAEKLLVGNTRLRTTSRKKHEEEHSLLVISTNFTAEFKKDASIYRLQCFEEPITEKRKVHVTVGFAYIRIQKQIHPMHYPEIFDHLSKISRGFDTWTSPEGLKEEDIDAHRRNLIEVPPFLNEKLTNSVMLKIKNACHNSGRDALKAFDICHKHTEDFCLAIDFELTYETKNEIVCVDSYPTAPTLMQIVHSLKASTKSRCKTLLKEDNLDRFSTTFSGFKLSYKVRDVDVKSESITNFIEGEEFYEGRCYFRILGKWCLVLDTYFVQVQSMFVDMLQKDFKGRGQNLAEHLPLSWTADIKTIPAYIDMYKNFADSDYIIPSSLNQSPFKKLFDIAKMLPDDEFVFYWLFPSLDGRIRDASSQILESIKILKQQQNPQLLTELYDSSNTLKDKYPSFIKFTDALNKNRITIVFCLTNSVDQTLVNEAELKSAITPDSMFNFLDELPETVRPVLRKSMNNISSNQMVEKLIALLRVHDYIDADQRATAKLLAVKLTRKLNITGIPDAIAVELHTFLKRNYASNFNGFVAKLEVLATRAGVLGVLWNFNICEIVKD